MGWFQIQKSANFGQDTMLCCQGSYQEGVEEIGGEKEQFRSCQGLANTLPKFVINYSQKIGLVDWDSGLSILGIGLIEMHSFQVFRGFRYAYLRENRRKFKL